MSGTQTRPVIEVLLSALGLAIWAAHFGSIYAANAFACERGLAGGRLFGLPLVAAVVGAITLAALLALGLVLLRTLAGLSPPLDEGGEREPHFTRWFAAGTAAIAALAVIFQATPALIVPACG